MRVVAGSPAHLACRDDFRIEAGDAVIAVDGMPVRELACRFSEMLKCFPAGRRSFRTSCSESKQIPRNSGE